MATVIPETPSQPGPADGSDAAPVGERPARQGVGRNRRLESAQLYRRIWRWHFYAGMFAAPVLFVAAVTGALYVFRVELEPIVYAAKLVVEPRGQTVPYQQQLAAAQSAAAPGGQLAFVSIPGSPATTDRATMFWFEIGDHVDQQMVYVDPYTAEVTGSHFRSTEFFNVVLKIHRTLFAGTFGRILIELATCWGIVLVITGVYLWWPKKLAVRGVFVPRLKAKTYTVLRDLHAVPAVYLSLFLFLIMLTGLVFTYLWGTGLRAGILVSGGFPESFVSPPQSTIPEHVDTPQPISLDAAVAVARAKGFANEALSVSVPHHAATDSYVVSVAQPTGPGILAQMYVDQYSGEILAYNDISNIPAATIALLYALPIHEGSIFGLPTKILAFVSALMLATLTVTGCWMWWKRRPQGTSGLPRRQEISVPRWMIGVIVVLGIVMPVVGISLLAVLLIDWLWQRRFVADRSASEQG